MSLLSNPLIILLIALVGAVILIVAIRALRLAAQRGYFEGKVLIWSWLPAVPISLTR